MNEPRIYSIVQVPILGQLGEDTEIVEGEPCPTCGQTPPERIEYLHYSFDYWEGAPLVGVAQAFAVTDDLRKALASGGLTGFSFREMYAEYGDTYEEQPGDPDLAEFWHLVVENRIKAASGWWTRRGVCPACGRPRWEMNDFTTRGIVRAHVDRDVPPRRAVRSDYEGWDIFNIDDPGPALITKRMRDFLVANGVVGLEIQEAAFVDSPEAA